MPRSLGDHTIIITITSSPSSDKQTLQQEHSAPISVKGGFLWHCCWSQRLEFSSYSLLIKVFRHFFDFPKNCRNLTLSFSIYMPSLLGVVVNRKSKVNLSMQIYESNWIKFSTQTLLLYIQSHWGYFLSGGVKKLEITVLVLKVCEISNFFTPSLLFCIYYGLVMSYFIRLGFLDGC